MNQIFSYLKIQKLSKSLRIAGKMNYFYILMGLLLMKSLMDKYSKVRFVVRMLMLVLGVGVCGTVAIASALILYPIGKGVWVNMVLARSYSFLTTILTGMHVEIVQGEQYLQHTQPTVFLCNHQSTLDLLVLGQVLPERCVVTAKREVDSTYSGSIYSHYGPSLFGWQEFAY
jgi:lysophosphatidate acyltransferase